MPPKAPLDPSIIQQAPVEPDPQDFNADESDYYLRMAGELAAENEALKAEVNQLRGKLTFEDVRTKLMEPYANRVFWFLIGYCGVVSAFLVAEGFDASGFHLPESVLAVLAGSTAAAAIGLVGFVVSGLFKSKTD